MLRATRVTGSTEKPEPRIARVAGRTMGRGEERQMNSAVGG